MMRKSKEELTMLSLRLTESNRSKESIKMNFTKKNKDGSRRLMIPEIIPMALFKKEIMFMLRSQRSTKKLTGKRNSTKKKCMNSSRETESTIKNLKK